MLPFVVAFNIIHHIIYFEEVFFSIFGLNSMGNSYLFIHRPLYLYYENVSIVVAVLTILKPNFKERMSSNNEDDVDMESSSFTLEDTYKRLLAVKEERAEEVKALISIVQNNDVKTFKPDVTPEEIQRKRLKFIQSMGKFVAQEQPKDLPVLDTPDFYANTLSELEDEVRAMKELHVSVDKEIEELESDVV